MGAPELTLEHVHRRDWRPCPATMPSPLRPTRPASVWLFEFAQAVQHHETLLAFAARWPDEFPVLREAAA